MDKDKDLFNTVEHAVMGKLCLAKNKVDADSLNRLVSFESAKDSWRKLYQKKINHTNKSFYTVASCIGKAAVFAHLDARYKKTANGIKKAGERAAALVDEVLSLIDEHATLRNMGNLFHPMEQAALSRILRGVVFARHGQDEDRWFPPETEAELDQLQARDYPEYSEMSTSYAYRVLYQTEISDESFLWHLKRFAELARESSDYNPLVPNPGAENADARVFSLEVCSILYDIYGTPCHGIVAGFATAIFYREIDGQMIKEWWKLKKGVII